MYLIENLSKVYQGRRDHVKALDAVSLKIERGSFVAITGSSGCGKTTLLLTLGGLVRPSSGAVHFEGKNLYDLPRQELSLFRNRKVGFVLQTFNLIPYLTALENVVLPMLFNSNNNGNGRRAHGAELLAQLGLADRQEHLPRELSIGQQQRVAIARALANNPDVILADEPTGNLDPTLSGEILTVLKDLNERDGRTIIMVTHSPLAAEYGTMRLRLKDGRIEDRIG
jgi:putative ABC transport system ATP-binding protein